MSLFLTSVTQQYHKTASSSEKEKKTAKPSVREIKKVSEQEIKATLFHGTQFGDVALVRHIITKYPQLAHIKNTEGQTLLHYAARYNKVDIAKLLIQQGADVNAKDNDGQTPLHLAVEWNYNYIDMIELLILGGADIQAKNGQNKTLLDCIREEDSSDHKTIKRISAAAHKRVKRISAAAHKRVEQSYNAAEQLFNAFLMENKRKNDVNRLGRPNDKIFGGFGIAIRNVITVAAQGAISKQEAIKAFRIAAQILQLEKSLEAQKPESLSEEQQNKLLHLYEDLYICFTAVKDKSGLRSALGHAFGFAPYIIQKLPSEDARIKHFRHFAPNAREYTAEAIRERVELEREVLVDIKIVERKELERIEAAEQQEKIEAVKKKEKDDFLSREMVYKETKIAFQQSLNSVEKDSPLYQWGLSIYNLIRLAISVDVLTPKQAKAAFEQARAVFKREQIGVKTPFAEQACGMLYKEFYTVFNSIADERVRALLLTTLGDSPYFQRYYKQHKNSLEDMIQDFSMSFEPLPDDSAKKARDALAIDLYLIDRMRTPEMSETISFKEETETTSGYLDTSVFPPRIVYPEETEGLYYKETGKTPLYVAVENGDLEKVKELVRKNPNSIHIADDRSITPLHIAVERGQLEIAEFLTGKTPLDYAEQQANERAIKLLKDKGATEVPALSPKKEEKEKEEIDSAAVEREYGDAKNIDELITVSPAPHGIKKEEKEKEEIDSAAVEREYGDDESIDELITVSPAPHGIKKEEKEIDSAAVKREYGDAKSIRGLIAPDKNAIMAQKMEQAKILKQRTSVNKRDREKDSLQSSPVLRKRDKTIWNYFKSENSPKEIIHKGLKYRCLSVN